MRTPTRPHQLSLFRPPYRMLVPLAAPESLARFTAAPGSALVWAMGSAPDRDFDEAVRRRPPGTPLLVLLPRGEEVARPQDLYAVVDRCRPHALLPFQEVPAPLDLRTLLAEPPSDLAGAVVEYLAWRGVVLDLEVRRTVRRILELSAELRSVSGLARGLYMSRRALGRHFQRSGLPVPSHWLHFGRLLRAMLDLQTPGATLMGVACRHGYPDGFSLSNQMKRLLGLRPTEFQGRLGWEWLVERWLQEEVRTGGFSVERARLLVRGAPAPSRPSLPSGAPRRSERQPA
ncbi:MAG: AraC family transcriptional regulator [Longimicrobiales bacterium]|nr:AraC family transcriptional regulator [Longimicrobiales bacterium]